MMIRDQSNETRDSLVQLQGWEKEIQKRDDELIEMAKQGKYGYEQPKTTNRPASKEQPKQVAPKKVKVEVEEPSSSSSEKKPLPGRGAAPFTYDDWAKLDSKLSKEDLDKQEEDSKETAESHKEKGNTFFKNKKFDFALKEYSIAIRLDPSNAVYYYNRSTAFASISNFIESEKDATEALRLDPRYVKAYHRRALSREALGKDILAIEDLEAIMKIDPSIDLVKKKLAEIRVRQGISHDGKIKEVKEPKVSIIKEEEPVEKPKPKIEIVEENKEETFPTRPHKISIVEESSRSLKEERTPKISIVEEETPSKVRIVEDKAPKKIEIIEDDQPKKVKIVDEVVPKKINIQDDGEKKSRKEIWAEADELLKPMETTKDPIPSSKKPKPIEKPTNAKAFRPWVDMFPEEFPERLSIIDPSEINNSLGNDVDGSLVFKIAQCLPNMEVERAFSFVQQISIRSDFKMLSFDPETMKAKPIVQDVLLKYSQIPNTNQSAIESIKKQWKIK